MDLFSLAAKLTLDTGEYEHGIESARSAAANFAKGLTSVVTAVSTTDRAVNNAADSAENLGTETSNAADGVSELRQAESDVARTSDNAADSIGSTADAVSELQDSSESVTRTIGESADSMNDAAGEARDLSRELDRAESEFDDTEDAIDDYTESADDAAKSTRKLGDEEEKTTKKTSTFGDTLKAILTSGAIKAGLSAIVNGVKAVGRAFINLGKSAVNAYGNYEQLADGVKKLYGNASKIVMENAKQAYKTSGMSANQYMEQATMFSASLVNSLGGNTKKAAELTDIAMRSIADNFNTFGSDIQSVQNAFQGFSKQNYTMLDNLKLGYGGTKSEMERLIKDANAYAKTIGEASNLTIDSFADVVKAIDLIQRKQGIAGTTIEEAQKTIQGSLNMTKAAWENLLVGIADDSADFDTLINNLVESATAAGSNLLPRVEQIIKGIGTAIEKLLPVIIERVPALIADVAPSIVSALQSTAKTAFDALITYLPRFVSFGAEIIVNIVNGVISALPKLLTSGVEIVKNLLIGIGTALPQIVIGIVEIIPQIVQALIDGVPELIQGAITFLMAIVEAIPQVVKAIAEALPQIVTSIVNGLIEAIPVLIDGAIQLLMAIVDAIPQILPPLIEALPQIINALVNGLIEALPLLLDGSIKLFMALIDAIPLVIEMLVPQIPQIIEAIITALLDNAPKILEAGLKLMLQLAEGMISSLPHVLDAVLRIGSSIVEGLLNSIGSVFSSIGSWLNEHVFKPFVNGLKSLFGIHSPSTVMQTIGKFIVEGFINPIKELPGKVWNFLVSTVSKVIQFGTDMKNKAVEAAKTFKDNIVNGLKELPDKMKNVGDQLVKGLWNGITNVKDWILKKIKGFGKNVLDGIKSFFGIKSPSRKTAEIGRFLVKGLAVGLEDEREATKAAEKLSNDVLSAFNSDGLAMAVSDLPDLNTDISTSLTATGAATNEESNTDKLLMMILETLTQLDDGMKDKIKSAVDGMGFNWNDREVGRFVKTYA